MNKAVFIPSAGLIPTALQQDFGRIPSVMIPLKNRPLLWHIYDKYQKEGYKVYVATNNNDKRIERYLVNNPTISISLIKIENSSCLGETILQGIDAIISGDDTIEQVVINFGDTIVADKLNLENVICFDTVSEQVDRWTAFQCSANKITAINDKSAGHNNLEKIFVGVFGFKNITKFYSLLSEAIETSNNNDMDPFYSALQLYSERTPDLVIKHVNGWQDFGHADTYYHSKKKFYTNSRFFNHIKIDAQRGILRKSSENKESLIAQAKWYLKLPSKVSYAAPRVFSYSLDYSDPYVEMEYYGYSNLTDLFLYADFDLGQWAAVFNSLNLLLNDFHQFSVNKSCEGVSESLHDMYIVKTLTRLEKIFSDDRFSLYQEPITVNGKVINGLNFVKETLTTLAESTGLLTPRDFTIIHGDLCFSNILYDIKNKVIRTIDPRGSFGQFDIYGDPLYDLAKLMHSVEGNYDFILNNLFDIQEDGSTFKLNIHELDHHSAIRQIFNKGVIQSYPQYVQSINLIHALLFLSLTPLHADNYLAQKGFLLVGLDKYQSAYDQAMNAGTV